MDTAIWWMNTLEGIQRRLAISPDIDDAALSAAKPELSDAQIMILASDHFGTRAHGQHKMFREFAREVMKLQAGGETS